MKKKFMSYDLGTTSTKAVLVSNDVEIIDFSVEDYKATSLHWECRPSGRFR